METYADRQKIFDSILLNKLEGFYDDLGWSLNLNPYKDKFFNFSQVILKKDIIFKYG